jgi:DGQHR domain-containing protein
VIEVEIDATNGKPGFVVDGQQRLSAFSGIKKPGFEVFVAALVCADYNELRQQFVLINNTRPLPKTLIYELLPSIEGLPRRFTARTFAARIVDRLNHASDSALLGEIRQHTNPVGMLSDTALQKLVMNSASDGVIRSFVQYEDREDRSFSLVNEFFAAVIEVFGPEWHGMGPRQSRLRHGAGLVAMGFVMDLLHSIEGATNRNQFKVALELLKPNTAWTCGQWKLAQYDERPWNGIQNTSGDIDLLSRYLVTAQKRALRQAR